jgi:nitrate reductase NapAB chaperone NapD
MKIEFEDKSYIECRKSDSAGKILIIISAKDQGNNLKKTTNIVEITTEQFKELISDIQV